MLLAVKTLLDRGFSSIVLLSKVQDGIVGLAPKIDQYLLIALNWYSRSPVRVLTYSSTSENRSGQRRISRVDVKVCSDKESLFANPVSRFSAV